MLQRSSAGSFSCQIPLDIQDIVELQYGDWLDGLLTGLYFVLRLMTVRMPPVVPEVLQLHRRYLELYVSALQHKNNLPSNDRILGRNWCRPYPSTFRVMLEIRETPGDCDHQTRSSVQRKSKTNFVEDTLRHQGEWSNSFSTSPGSQQVCVRS